MGVPHVIKMPAVDARRTLIANSALDVIGARGMRALSHAAVDLQAALPKGSTSYYCRKRIDLLRLTLQRLFEIDRDDMDPVVDKLVSKAPVTSTDVAWVVAGVVEKWLSLERRPRTRARFELFLAVSHEDELREMNNEHLLWLLGLSKAVAEAIDPPSAMEHVVTTLMLADGLMISVIRQDLPSPSRSDIAQLFATAIGSPIPVESDSRREIDVLRATWD